MSDRVDFPSEEERILAYWDKISAFQTSLANNADKPPFTFYDGPPFATGLPHYGHILAGTIKDVVTRYASQTGFYVSRRFGWGQSQQHKPLPTQLCSTSCGRSDQCCLWRSSHHLSCCAARCPLSAVHLLSSLIRHSRTPR